MAGQLALEGPSASTAVDSLAYVDTMTSTEKISAEALIDKEMGTMKRAGKKPEQHLGDSRPPSSFLEFPVRSSSICGW